MSVHQESLEAPKPSPRVEEPPDLAYNAVRNESLAMFGAAAGGAVVGMMLTLLVLAIINGGTLNFSGGERMDVLEASVARINDNVGAVSYNTDVIAQQAAAIAQDLETVQTSLRAEIDAQAGDITALNQSIDTLDMTRQRLDVFVGAMQQAFTDMATIEGAGAAAPDTATAVTAAAPAATVVLFVDENDNGAFDAGEPVVSGAQVIVLDAAGKALAEAVATADGATLEGLEPGQYALSIENLDGYALAVEGPASLTVDAGDGQTLYLPVVAEGN